MYNPKSLENLQRFDEMDTAKHRELSRRGGIASAKRRREMRAEREALTALLKYGDAFRAFARLADLPPKQFDKMVNKILNHGKKSE